MLNNLSHVFVLNHMLLDLPGLKHPPFEYLLGVPLKYKQGVFILITS